MLQNFLSLSLLRVRVTSIKIPNESPNPPVSSHSLVRIQRPSVHASVISDEFTCRDIWLLIIQGEVCEVGGGGRPLSTAIDYGPRGVCAERRCSRRCLFFFMMICIIWVYTGCVVCLCCVYGWLAVLYLIKVWLFILIYESFCRVWV